MVGRLSRGWARQGTWGAEQLRHLEYGVAAMMTKETHRGANWTEKGVNLRGGPFGGWLWSLSKR